jgi:hypothetical protein
MEEIEDKKLAEMIDESVKSKLVERQRLWNL